MVRWGPKVTDVVGSVRLCGVVMIVGIRYLKSAKENITPAMAASSSGTVGLLQILASTI